MQQSPYNTAPHLSLPKDPPPQKSTRPWIIAGIVVLALFALFGAVLFATTENTPAPAIFPPTSENDVHALAKLGNTRGIRLFHSENVGDSSCPQPKKEVLVDEKVTGQQLAQNLLAYFYAEHMDSPCGSLLLAYHNQLEAGKGYTAGRITLGVATGAGMLNTDPKGQNLNYTMIIDTGNYTRSTEYTVKW